MNNGLERIKKQVKKLKNSNKIIAVVLFGSLARGEEKPLSDIDICIIPRKGVKIEDALKLTADMEGEVSFFYHLPLHIRYEIFAEGKPLLINNEEEYNEIKSKTILKYLDIKPMRERLLKRALESGVF